MKRLFPLLFAFAAIAQAQNSAPIVLNSLPSPTLYANAGPLAVDLTTAFQDPDLAKAVRLTTDQGEMILAVYDRQAPITAANFLRYVNDGRYFLHDSTTNQLAYSFIHRSVPGFVLQGGGYIATVDPADSAKQQLKPTAVQAYPAIQNEFHFSNKRATLSMAKLGGDPNSATSQWFINLADNSSNLDNQNGGFSVFARVLGDGMNVADRIAALPIGNFGGNFTDLPMHDYTTGVPKVSNVVSLLAITEIDPVHSPLDFTASSDNTGVADVVISGEKMLVRGKGAGFANITVTATDLDGAAVSQTFAVTVIDQPSRFANISTRMDVGTDPNALIGGFIVRGTAPKRLIVRASIPSGVSGTLADPQLELYNSAGDIVATNDNWATDTKQDIIDVQLTPKNAKESAIIATLPASDQGTAYTAIVRGASSGTGIGLIEIYDLDSGPGSSLVNISTRGRVDVDPKVMIGGFIITGNGSNRVLIRALGPSLPVSGTLSDPKLQLVNASGDVVAENDDWETSPDKDAIIASGVMPSNAKEAAVLQTLAPGAFTAIVSGANGAKGVAAVEAYQLD